MCSDLRRLDEIYPEPSKAARDIACHIFNYPPQADPESLARIIDEALAVNKDLNPHPYKQNRHEHGD